MKTPTETVYALRNDGVTVYVGRSVRPIQRADQHRARGVKFDECIILAQVPQTHSSQVETDAIKALKPTLNRTSSGNGFHSRGRSEEVPISIRLLEIRQSFDKRVALSGIGQNDLVWLAVEELLAKYTTPEATIAAQIRSRTAAMQEDAA